MTFASRNLTLDAQSQQESHVKWTSLCIEPNAKSLKLFNPQSQPKMPSDTAASTIPSRCPAAASSSCYRPRASTPPSCIRPLTMEALILVATVGGPTMFAGVGVMRALNRHVERVFDPSRIDTHWGRRKLKTDQ